MLFLSKVYKNGEEVQDLKFFDVNGDDIFIYYNDPSLMDCYKRKDLEDFTFDIAQIDYNCKETILSAMNWDWIYCHFFKSDYRDDGTYDERDYFDDDDDYDDFSDSFDGYSAEDYSRDGFSYPDDEKFEWMPCGVDDLGGCRLYVVGTQLRRIFSVIDGVNDGVVHKILTAGQGVYKVHFEGNDIIIHSALDNDVSRYHFREDISDSVKTDILKVGLLYF